MDIPPQSSEKTSNHLIDGDLQDLQQELIYGIIQTIEQTFL